MMKLLTLLAALMALSACTLTGGGAGHTAPTFEHVCQTGGRGCG